ncbi:unnamed protein product [Lactuca virosa]|uniref:Uncharacterized protein n=1 Tax=Lactuca virosa TaxID=75947 RepID=A0AAU9PR02_9ASTR|nr:unnamed protein product [Lactuca virosa]
MKLQSRLEQEEEAKAALLSRIQRLTKLILVSTKSTPASRFSHRPNLRRRHSFGEEELAYLPHRKRDLILEDEDTELYVSLDGSVENNENALKEEKKTKKPGLLNWLKPRKRDSISGASDKSSDIHTLYKQKPDILNSHQGARLDQEINNEDTFLQQESCLISIKTIDQIDLLREQQKILSEEIAIHLSALKRLSPEAASEREFINVEINRLNEQIELKNDQIKLLQDKIANPVDEVEKTRPVSELELEAQLNEKSFQLEVKSGDNRVLQEQLSEKINDCEELQNTINSLKEQLSEINPEKNEKTTLLCEAQALEIEELKHKVSELTESNEQLQSRNKKLAEDSSYAKGLASAAAVELKALSEEVAKLMNHNEKLSAELASHKNSPLQRSRPMGSTKNGHGRKDHITNNFRQKEVHNNNNNNNNNNTQVELKRELALSRERELNYEAVLSEKDERELELQRTVEESKQREAYLENELANMWILVAKLKKGESEESSGGDGFESERWNGIGERKEFV